nr:MAG TPA: hypothetical protein [Caudoviricetes sp.]
MLITYLNTISHTCNKINHQKSITRCYSLCVNFILVHSEI